MTISANELLNSFVSPVQLIGPQGNGQLTIPLWFRMKMVNGTQGWQTTTFAIYPEGLIGMQGSQGFQGVQGLQPFNIDSIDDTQGRFISAKDMSSSDKVGNQGPFGFENDAWVGSLSSNSLSTLSLKLVQTPFSQGDVVTDLITGATCSVVEAGAITYTSQFAPMVAPPQGPYQSLVISGVNGTFNFDDQVSGFPSGGSATVSAVTINSQGDYDMKLWIGYQVIDVS